MLSFAVVLLSILAACSAQSLPSGTFSQVASTSAFPPREYAACAQAPPTSSGTSTIYFFGGFSVTLGSTSGSYNDGYYNDAWSSNNLGQSWTQLTTAAPFRPQGWNGAVYTSTGGIVYIGGGNDTNAAQNNEVWSSTDGKSWTQLTNGPWDPRETAGIAGQLGTNNILVALGNTRNDFGVDDIWLTTNAGQSWTKQCSGTACPFVTSVNGNASTSAQVHGPAAAGLSTGQWLLIGGYGSDSTGTSGITDWVTNQVAVSSNGFQSFTTYAAPWSPRAQQRVTVDTDNVVYVYGGVYDLPLSGTSTGATYTSVPSQAYYTYFTDIWYSTNAASSSATWTQLSTNGFGSASYPGVPFPGNPNSVNSAFFTQGAPFNPCFAVSGTGSNKQLVLYTGLYAGYRQNNATNVAVAYPGVYTSASYYAISSSTGNTATSVAVNVVAVAVALCVAVASVAL